MYINNNPKPLPNKRISKNERGIKEYSEEDKRFIIETKKPNQFYKNKVNQQTKQKNKEKFRALPKEKPEECQDGHGEERIDLKIKEQRQEYQITHPFGEGLLIENKQNKVNSQIKVGSISNNQTLIEESKKEKSKEDEVDKILKKSISFQKSTKSIEKSVNSIKDEDYLKNLIEINRQMHKSSKISKSNQSIDSNKTFNSQDSKILNKEQFKKKEKIMAVNENYFKSLHYTSKREVNFNKLHGELSILKNSLEKNVKIKPFLTPIKESSKKLNIQLINMNRSSISMKNTNTNKNNDFTEKNSKHSIAKSSMTSNSPGNKKSIKKFLTQMKFQKIIEHPTRITYEIQTYKQIESPFNQNEDYLNEISPSFTKRYNEKQESFLKRRNGFISGKYFSNYILNEVNFIDKMRYVSRRYYMILDDQLNNAFQKITTFKDIFSIYLKQSTLSVLEKYVNNIKSNSDHMTNAYNSTISQLIPYSKYMNEINIDEKSYVKSSNIKYIRRSESDGDSFYRLFIFAMLEYFVLKSQIRELQKIILDVHKVIQERSEELGKDKDCSIYFFKICHDILYLLERNEVSNAYLLLIGGFNSKEKEFDRIIVFYIRQVAYCIATEYYRTILGGIYNEAELDDINLYMILNKKNEANKLSLQLLPMIYNVNLDLLIYENEYNVKFDYAKSKKFHKENEFKYSYTDSNQVNSNNECRNIDSVVNNTDSIKIEKTQKTYKSKRSIILNIEEKIFERQEKFKCMSKEKYNHEKDKEKDEVKPKTKLTQKSLNLNLISQQQTQFQTSENQNQNQNQNQTISNRHSIPLNITMIYSLNGYMLGYTSHDYSLYEIRKHEDLYKIDYFQYETRVFKDKSCEKCNASKEYKELEIPFYSIKTCFYCLYFHINKVLSKRITVMNKENFNSKEYYSRPVRINGNVSIDEYAYKTIFKESFSLTFRRILSTICFCCDKIKSNNEIIRLDDCLCQMCYDCVHKKVIQNTKGYVCLNLLEKTCFEKVSCVCNKVLDIDNLLLYFPIDVNQLNENSIVRNLKYIQTMCMICINVIRNEVMIKKKEGEGKIFKSVQVEEKEFELNQHIICLCCINEMRNKREGVNLNEKQLIACRICCRNHELSRSSVDEIYLKKKCGNICSLI